MLRTFTNDIQSALISAWGGTTPIALENRAFNPTPNSPWIRLSIVPANSRQITIGSPSVTRHFGLVYITIFSPIGEGTERSDWLYDKVVPIFDKKTVAGATFETPYPTSGVDNGEGWYVRNCVCPYRYDEIS